ncbi:hypothetical protein Rleg_5666 (plasmid) [Rhizobium leguminosarum bv. trifolii WSM1325]|uniref:Uncharacterized protein n=1 Tax=Rhizobium leguminosarum bv. trifolii (strain WSM1325) TaxID=395491 RepID=C6B981_RHILS|nr:hypothetical protein [Rhizobium leguminosarum]ACS60469.1 hypothetical protein Rleg_5666 [Rhizobium leguminosarum bv. trifolii WSM1325]
MTVILHCVMIYCNAAKSFSAMPSSTAVPLSLTPLTSPTDLGHKRLTTQNAADRFKAERVFADASMVVDPLILIDISEMIRDAGYYVAEATSGDEAFAFLETPGSLELQTRSRRDDGEDPPMSPSSLP